MCAPDRFPHGEWINTIAVMPMAIPAMTFLSMGSTTVWLSVDVGDASAVATSPAAIMKEPRAQASMRYSGQWARNACKGVMSASCLEAGVQRHAPIAKQADAVDVVGIVGCQPRSGATNLFSLSNPLVRNQFHQFLISSGRVPGRHVDGCPNGTRTYGVDPDAVRSHFLCKALHHQHH